MPKIIVGNWKCNPNSLKKAKELLFSLKKRLKNIKIKKTKIVICPPFLYLKDAQEILNPLKSSNIMIGAQDCFWENEGAFTGEISPQMLKDIGCSFVILGHSERRKFLKESDRMITKKIVKALKNNLHPILCVGETLEEKEKNLTFKIIEKELINAFQKVPKRYIEKVIIAYEPIWAIGSGRPCSPNEALVMSLFIKKVILKLLNRKTTKNIKIKILYGGSVNSQNAKGYLSQQNINGLLVGGASLNPDEFAKIIKEGEGI